MPVIVHSPPESEPVTLDEARAQLRLDDDQTEENTLISGYITAARSFVEETTARRLITQTVDRVLDRFPAATFPLFVANVQAIESITYIDADGNEQTLPATAYRFDTTRGYLQAVDSWPDTADQINAATIRLTVGYGDAASVPQPIKQAILLLVSYWFNTREAASETTIKTAPLAVAALLAPYRYYWGD